MDPNANLQEQERLLVQHDTVRLMTKDQRYSLVELRQALYDWIRDGGFEPDWTLAPMARKYYGR